MILKFVFGLFVALALVKLYFVRSAKKCINKVCLIGKTVIVTGANTGIGFCSALEFAKRGARVILACRDKAKAEAARAEIIKQTGNENVVIQLVDFSSLDSVKQCANDIIQTEPRIDILVNNAGAGGLLEKTTPDGLQILMQINYFGPVLFTLSLFEVLKKSRNARIINVASLLAKIGEFDPRDLNKYAGRYGTYANTKLCNILFTMKFAEKLKGSTISIFSLHPGAVRTDIFRKVTSWRKVLLDFVAYFTFKTPEDGAQTIIYLATERNIESLSGKHFEECEVVPPYPSVTNAELSDAVWEETCRLLHITKNDYSFHKRFEITPSSNQSFSAPDKLSECPTEVWKKSKQALAANLHCEKCCVPIFHDIIKCCASESGSE